MSSLNATQTPSESQAVAGYAERIPIPIFFLILFLIFAYVVGSFSAFVTLRNLPGIRHRGIFLAATLTGSEVLLIIFDSFRKAVPNYWCGIHFFLPALAIPGSALSVTAQSIRLVHMWTLHTDLAQSNFTSGSGSNEQRKERQKRPPWWIRYRPWLTDRTLAFIALLLILMMIAIVSLLTTADSSITWRNFSQDNPEAPCSTRSPLLFVPLGTFIGFFLLIVTPTFWWLSRNINDTFEIRKDLRYGIVVGGVGVAGGLFWELGITRIFPQVPVSGNLIFGLFQVVGFQTCLVLMPVLREWKVEKLVLIDSVQ
ncbi:hypothetical protein BJ742DRAFT_518284 [Cladochytrium replicatum]|nr:hypothetical protein BJ742DRAFT_518284 [Cladochytrium replicatum]